MKKNIPSVADIRGSLFAVLLILATANIQAQTLSGSTPCAGSLLTEVSSVTPTQIVWELGGTGVNTVTATIAAAGKEVAGTGAESNGATQLNGPNGVYVDDSGNIYVSDQDNARIQKWAAGATSGITVAGTGIRGGGTTKLSYPSGVYVDGSGNIYVADWGNDRIQKWAPGATSGTTVAGGNGSGTGATQLSGPDGVYVDGSGNIYVTDEDANRVQKWAAGATTGITVAGSSTGVSGSDATKLNQPDGVYVDGSGNIYVSDQNNNRVQKWAAGATSGTTVAGTGVYGSGANQLYYPGGVFVDGNDNVYVADNYNNRIQKWAPGATTGTTVAGTGVEGSGITQLNLPEGVYVDDTGDIYVADWNNNRVQKFKASIITTYIAATAGSYAAVVTTEDGSVTTTNTVTVNALPTISAGSNVAICAGTTTTLNATGGVSYVWSADATLSATTGASVVADPAGKDTYTVTGTDVNGCVNTASVTVSVNALPTISAGSNVAICAGTTTTLNATGGVSYVWSVDATLSATTGASVAADPAGKDTYTVTGTDVNGCVNTASVTVSVNALPTISAGSNVAICAGTTTTLNATGGVSYVWSADATLSATTGASVAADPAGKDTYTVTGTDVNGCMNTASVTVTVNALPTISAGSNVAICAGTTTTLNATGGVSYVWSADATLSATTGASVVADPAGMDTYTVTGTDVNGCMNTASVTVSVNPLPDAGSITGTTTVCVAATTNLTDTTTGGVWSSNNTAVFTVGSTTGVVTGVSANSAEISYTATNGCGTVAVTAIVFVDPLPDAGSISGAGLVCRGATITLSDVAGGGVWNSAGGASVDGSGDVTGTSAGTATISYTVTNGCGANSATLIITVNTTSAGTITGPSSVDSGSNIILADAIGGGTWSASNGNAIISGGLVTGETAGTDTIFYTVTGSCGTAYATRIITVNNSSGIPPNNICAGGSITLTNSTPGGVWSMHSDYASVGSSTGIVTASAALTGTATVTYTVGGVTTTTVITVNPNPKAIQGVIGECAGTTITLTDATIGGTWSGSGDATVSGTGTSGTFVADSTAGTATVTYTILATGCSSPIFTNTIYANPQPIGGVFTMCTGITTLLTDATMSGTGGWSSSNTAVATVSGFHVTGQGAGTAVITYVVSPGNCSTTQEITVNAQPAGITGNTSPACPGASFTLADGTGVWSSSNTSVATIGSANGVVSSVSGGTATITYLALGIASCIAKTVVTINAAPVISGATAICLNGTTALSDVTSGGTWNSGSPGIATVSSAGVVTGVFTGTSTITYTTAASCTGMVTVTVNSISVAIMGNLSTCLSTTTTLSDAITGGTWSMASSYASVGSATGVVTASATLTGTATISYTSGGCSVSNVVTVNANPKAVQAPTGECAGTTVTITDATAGGSWSGTGGNALVSGTGTSGTLVAGSTGGTETITYTIIATGCSSAVFTNTIYSNPAPITGTTFNLCTGVTVLLSDATMSGTGGWYSSNTAVATISGFHVTGQSAGTSVISYVVTPGNCSITQIVSVDVTPVVGAISGPASISESHPPVTLSDATGGGNWTSSNAALIELLSGTSTPTVTAEALGSTGSAVISYTVVNGWCSTTVTKTVGATTAAHPGGGTTTGNPTLVYAGSAVSLGGDAGGIWSSSDNGIATVDGSGLVTGITVGNVNITHVTRDDGTTTTNVTNVVVAAVPASISLLPNPNKGTFVVRGTVGSVADEEVTLEVTDVLGQVIYKSKVIAEGGRLNETIMLGNALANGMYMLNVQSGTENKTLHFVIAQ